MNNRGWNPRVREPNRLPTPKRVEPGNNHKWLEVVPARCRTFIRDERFRHDVAFRLLESMNLQRYRRYAAVTTGETGGYSYSSPSDFVLT